MVTCRRVQAKSCLTEMSTSRNANSTDRSYAPPVNTSNHEPTRQQDRAVEDLEAHGLYGGESAVVFYCVTKRLAEQVDVIDQEAE